jgi:hypothetical protein
LERLIREHLAGKRIPNKGEHRKTINEFVKTLIEENPDFFDSKLADAINKMKSSSKLNYLIEPLLDARIKSLPKILSDLEHKLSLARIVRNKSAIGDLEKQIAKIKKQIMEINKYKEQLSQKKTKSDRIKNYTHDNNNEDRDNITTTDMIQKFAETRKDLENILVTHKDIRAELFRECFDKITKTFDRNKYEQLIGAYFIFRQNMIHKPETRNELLTQAKEQSPAIYKLLTAEFGIPVEKQTILSETTPTIKEIAIEPELKLEPIEEEAKQYKEYIDPKIRNNY